MDLAVLAKPPIGAITSWQHAIQPEDLTERVFSPLTRRSGTLARYRRELPSYFPPPDAWLRGSGRNWRGRRGRRKLSTGRLRTSQAIWDQVGIGRDPRGGGGATCKIAGIAYTGSNPVPAT